MRMSKYDRKKKIVRITAGMIIVLTIVFFSVRSYSLKNNKENKENKEIDAFINQYTTYVNDQKFSEFIQLFSDDSFVRYSTSKEETIKRYQSIFEGIGTEKIEIKNLATKKDKNNSYELSYNLEIETANGHISTDKYRILVNKNEKGYRLDWSPNLIFPDMKGKDSIKVEEDNVERGEILDRNGKKLAENYDYQQIGVNPAKLGEGIQKDQTLQVISEKFNIPIESINKKLSQSWAKGDVFVPIKTLEKSISHLDIMELPTGVVMGSVKMRHYPLEESAAHLLGYISKVNAEEIQKKPYLSENDYIGRSGLEATFDEKLRGKNGIQISIVNENGEIKKTLLNRKKVDSIDLKLTIASEAQKIAFDSLEGKPASVVISNPKNGELLVTTGSPSYNPNKMTLGISEDDYKIYEADKNFPFMSRFANRYAPGSTFKTITAAIGLDSGHINETEERSIEGLKWQKDDSWGSFWTTRVKETPIVNLKNALVTSDNIFFAQKSLEMGEDVIREGLNKFIFGEELEIPIYMEPASILNDDKFRNDILLADTAYGQGELMISPISQLAMYSVFMNDGTIVYPQIIKDQKVITKKDVIGSNSANIVLNDLIDVVASPDGYVYSLFNPSFTLAAKTGTAEIKEKQDTLGTENSFLLFFDVNNRNFMGLIMSEDSRKNGTATEKASLLVKYLEDNY